MPSPHADKRLGQHFLSSPALLQRIADVALAPNPLPILEIGPGPGNLTKALLNAGAPQLLAVERDRRFTPILQSLSPKISVLFADAAQANLCSLLPAPFRVAGNLPFNAASQILFQLLNSPSWPPPWLSLTLMFQKEVASRIVATHGSKTFGTLSVLSQWRSSARLLFSIPPDAFSPAPLVHAAVVRIEPLPQPPNSSLHNLSSLVKILFRHRRKTLLNSLKPLLQNPQTSLKLAELSPQQRPETLSVAQFVRLSQILSTTL